MKWITELYFEMPPCAEVRGEILDEVGTGPLPLLLKNVMRLKEYFVRLKLMMPLTKMT
jgi:hypothetical protein